MKYYCSSEISKDAVYDMLDRARSVIILKVYKNDHIPRGTRGRWVIEYKEEGGNGIE